MDGSATSPEISDILLNDCSCSVPLGCRVSMRCRSYNQHGFEPEQSLVYRYSNGFSSVDLSLTVIIGTKRNDRTSMRRKSQFIIRSHTFLYKVLTLRTACLLKSHVWFFWRWRTCSDLARCGTHTAHKRENENSDGFRATFVRGKTRTERNQGVSKCDLHVSSMKHASPREVKAPRIKIGTPKTPKTDGISSNESRQLWKFESTSPA